MLCREDSEPCSSPLTRLTQPPRLLRLSDLLAREFVSNVQEHVIKLVAALVQAAADADEQLVHTRILLISTTEGLIQSNGIRQFRLPRAEVHVASAGGARDAAFHDAAVGFHRAHDVEAVRHAPKIGLVASGLCRDFLHQLLHGLFGVGGLLQTHYILVEDAGSG